MSNFSRFDSSFFQLRAEESSVVLTMTRDQLTEEENLEQWDEDFITLIDNYQVRNMVLDMSRVRYMTSSAIGKLISLHRRLARQGGKLVLAALQEEVEQILDTSHLLDYFLVAPTPQAGLQQLSA